MFVGCRGEEPDTQISEIPPTSTPIDVTQIPKGVEVSNITEENIATNEITQRKTFDQCASASPFNADIEFSSTSGQQTQEELVLTGNLGGELALSPAAKVKIGGEIQNHFAMVANGGRGHNEAAHIQVPPRTKQEYIITWQEYRRDGQVEYVEDGETKFGQYSYRIGVELVSSTVVDLECPNQVDPEEGDSSDPTPLPTYTPYPTYTPLPTQVQPTAAPASPEPTNIPLPAVPTDVPVPTSPPQNTGLSVGQWYTAGSLSFVVDDVSFFGGDNSFVRLTYRVKNVGNGPISFQYSSYNFTVHDNLGTTYPIDSTNGESRTVNLDPGETTKIVNPWFSWWDYEGNYANTSVTQVTVVVSDISLIERAEWVIPISH